MRSQVASLGPFRAESLELRNYGFGGSSPVEGLSLVEGSSPTVGGSSPSFLEVDNLKAAVLSGNEFVAGSTSQQEVGLGTFAGSIDYREKVSG
jgi:hypothetical protein